MTTHLHWLFREGPQPLRGLTTGYTLCSLCVSREELTAFVDDVDCPKCVEAAEQLKNDRKPRKRVRL